MKYMMKHMFHHRFKWKHMKESGLNSSLNVMSYKKRMISQLP